MFWRDAIGKKSKVPFPEINKTTVTPEVLGKFTRESDFVWIAVDLLKESASYVCIGANILGENPSWDRNQAIIGGNAVRLFKLLSAFLDQVCQERRETADILARLVFETAVSTRYLIRFFSDELALSYIKHSLRHERKLLDRINSNISERAGILMPIEDRMLKSLDRTAKLAGIPLEDIDLDDRAPWGRKNLHQKAQAIGWGELYDGMFGGMSHNVHGSWQDLYAHHLEADDNGRFTPDLNWNRPRPQPIFALGQVANQTASDVIAFLGVQLAYDQLKHKLEDLHERIESADNAHEAYLTGKTWPEI